MKRREKPGESAVRMVGELAHTPLFTLLEESLLETLPESYLEAAEHFINARIELLNALKSLVERRIERLERHRERLRKKSAQATKREKVPVE